MEKSRSIWTGNFNTAGTALRTAFFSTVRVSAKPLRIKRLSTAGPPAATLLRLKKDGLCSLIASRPAIRASSLDRDPAARAARPGSVKDTFMEEAPDNAGGTAGRRSSPQEEK